MSMEGKHVFKGVFSALMCVQLCVHLCVPPCVLSCSLRVLVLSFFDFLRFVCGRHCAAGSTLCPCLLALALIKSSPTHYSLCSEESRDREPRYVSRLMCGLPRGLLGDSLDKSLGAREPQHTREPIECGSLPQIVCL